MRRTPWPKSPPHGRRFRKINGASDARKDAAKDIADAVGVRSVSVIEKNPVCCICFTINQRGGSIISAAEEQCVRCPPGG